jgi:signal transduction histidine kinase
MLPGEYLGVLMLWVGLALMVGLLIGSSVAYLLAARRVRISIARAQNAQKRAQAAEHLAEIGSMTGGLAHEIKNPLSTIGLNAQLLSESIGDLPIEEQDRSRLIRRIGALGRETERLRGILEDFLEYAGELRLTITDQAINTIIEELADFFSPMADGAKVRLSVETDPSNPRVPVDADHLKQALLNLMLNAVHAMEQTDSTSRELIVRVELSDDEHDGLVVRVHVIDTGPGMNNETLSKIFHPYFTTKSGGTGLGLPTARRIIQAHQGRLEVHSELGKGTDFVLTLPLD